MKFDMTKIAAFAMAMAMAMASPGAHAVLTSVNTLSIQNDAVTASVYDPVNETTEWYVSSDGPLADSFFTLGWDGKTKQSVDTQFAYLYNGSPLTLTGAIQSSITTFTFQGLQGSFETIGTGISILSASGDSATVGMSGWVVDWDTANNIPLGTYAWSDYTPGVPYVNGIGNILCDAGSGCAVGSNYTLKYTAGSPTSDPSGIPYVPFYLELHGTVGAVPEASTYAMLLAGLGLVGAAARSRRG